MVALLMWCRRLFFLRVFQVVSGNQWKSKLWHDATVEKTPRQERILIAKEAIYHQDFRYVFRDSNPLRSDEWNGDEKKKTLVLLAVIGCPCGVTTSYHKKPVAFFLKSEESTTTTTLPRITSPDRILVDRSEYENMKIEHYGPRAILAGIGYTDHLPVLLYARDPELDLQIVYVQWSIHGNSPRVACNGRLSPELFVDP